MSKLKKHNAKKERGMKILIEFYKRNLDVFIERELGVKLTKWQKFILKRMRLSDGTK